MMRVEYIQKEPQTMKTEKSQKLLLNQETLRNLTRADGKLMFYPTTTVLRTHCPCTDTCTC